MVGRNHPSNTTTRALWYKRLDPRTLLAVERDDVPILADKTETIETPARRRNKITIRKSGRRPASDHKSLFHAFVRPRATIEAQKEHSPILKTPNAALLAQRKARPTVPAERTASKHSAQDFAPDRVVNMTNSKTQAKNQIPYLPQKQNPFAPTNPTEPVKKKTRKDSDGAYDSKQFEKSP